MAFIGPMRNYTTMSVWPKNKNLLRRSLVSKLPYWGLRKPTFYLAEANANGSPKAVGYGAAEIILYG